MSKDNENGENPELSIPPHELNLRIQILDYLFERGHKVSKPLIHAMAHFTYDYGQALFEQGRMKGHADQFAKDMEEGIEP